jgi:hypothetical protein
MTVEVTSGEEQTGVDPYACMSTPDVSPDDINSAENASPAECATSANDVLSDEGGPGPGACVRSSRDGTVGVSGIAAGLWVGEKVMRCPAKS